MEAGEAAARIQARMLSALEGVFNEHPEKESIIQHIKADPLRLIKDAMDRAFGTAVQKVDNMSSDGSMSNIPPNASADDLRKVRELLYGKPADKD